MQMIKVADLLISWVTENEQLLCNWRSLSFKLQSDKKTLKQKDIEVVVFTGIWHFIDWTFV